MNPISNINSKQKKILDFLYHSIEVEHYCPTVREIGAHINMRSPSSVQSHINALIDACYIERDEKKKRSLRLTVKAKSLYNEDGDSSNFSYKQTPSLEGPSIFGQSLKNVPLIGAVQAGMPITATENHEADLVLPMSLTGNSDCFLLRVQGESMKNIGIYEDDLLLVRNQSTANNGDIVVARIDEEATVKRFFKEKNYIRLQPENDDFDPIIVKDCIIEGKVIGLIRDRI